MRLILLCEPFQIFLKPGGEKGFHKNTLSYIIYYLHTTEHN